jgi:hypothetical protein
MTRTRLLTALATLAAGLTLAGAGTAAAFTDDTARPAATPVAVAAASTTTRPTPSATGTSADDAGRVAVRHLGGGSASLVERELEHGRQVWDVDVRRGSGTVEVHVDALTGAVSRVEDRGDGRDDRSGRGRGDDRGRNDQGRDDRGGDDQGRHGRHGDDGPGHDALDDRGGDR